MGAKASAALEQSLNHSLMIHRVIERAIHDSEAMWQLRPEGGPSLYASVSLVGRTVTFESIGRLPRPMTPSYVELLINGEPSLLRPMSTEVTPSDSITISLSLDTYALA
jgi:hypothetical protein